MNILHRSQCLDPFGVSYDLILRKGLVYYLFFELLQPLFVVAAYVYLYFAVSSGFLNLSALGIVAAIGVVMNVGVTAFAVWLEERYYSRHPSLKSGLKLSFYAVLEIFGYRQLNTYWRLVGLIKSFSRFSEWGEMKRTSFVRSEVGDGDGKKDREAA